MAEQEVNRIQRLRDLQDGLFKAAGAAIDLDAKWALEHIEEAEDSLNSMILDIPFTGMTQDDFVNYLALCREAAWDIAGTLIHNEDGEGNGFDTDEMYPPHDGEGWVKIWQHFKEVHQLNVFDPRINWEFDT